MVRYNFNRYLGQEYEYFGPELGVVQSQAIGIRVLVNGINNLENIIYRAPRTSIRHIGDPIWEYEVTP